MKNGWHPIEPSKDSIHIIWDGLYINDRCVAMLEAFSDDGPYYCNAITPQGEHRRLGAGVSLPRARNWAEVMVGLKPDHDNTVFNRQY